MNHYNRRDLLAMTATGLFTAGITSQLTAQDKPKPKLQPAIQWHDVQEWGVEGKGFSDTELFYDRLPARAKGVVRDAVWNLSRHSAGMLVRFRTDATTIWADYGLQSANLAMAHMPATGKSGLDLYAEDKQGNLRWIAVVKPTAQQMNIKLIEGLLPGERNYIIYLPLYNGTEYLKIGVPKENKFIPVAPRTEKPMVFYGTSITHGACASRPGMPHPALLGRWLNRPVINLGFSGNGRMELEVGQYIAEIDPSVFVIDCLPNMNGPWVVERTEPLVHQLRKARPNVPIMLVEDRTKPNAPFLPSRQRGHDESRAALQTAYKNLQQAGVDKLYYLEGDKLLGKDREDTTDGSHPSDLGFYRQAKAMLPVLKKALG